ncbi:hypothetical protein PPERSA_02894 [Pseudocohnilembus persalinus]|uniref:Uncharacterized protein n=1 Tax=Pseudocohnilembus persalinus TaxID=266149 RepID=A0A0V0QML5_PSEPJ|nr:hypothetical protein PPERSA_02894 [Pseudocohnilembus persalinus]|eukprot:KRX03515.1 hypothetical protein PPERSA_02894 [Pseudocohnilembus persalinus]
MQNQQQTQYQKEKDFKAKEQKLIEEKEELEQQLFDKLDDAVDSLDLDNNNNKSNKVINNSESKSRKGSSSKGLDIDEIVEAAQQEFQNIQNDLADLERKIVKWDIYEQNTLSLEDIMENLWSGFEEFNEKVGEILNKNQGFKDGNLIANYKALKNVLSHYQDLIKPLKDIEQKLNQKKITNTEHHMKNESDHDKYEFTELMNDMNNSYQEFKQYANQIWQQENDLEENVNEIDDIKAQLEKIQKSEKLKEAEIQELKKINQIQNEKDKNNLDEIKSLQNDKITLENTIKKIKDATKQGVNELNDKREKLQKEKEEIEEKYKKLLEEIQASSEQNANLKEQIQRNSKDSFLNQRLSLIKGNARKRAIRINQNKLQELQSQLQEQVEKNKTQEEKINELDEQKKITIQHNG